MALIKYTVPGTPFFPKFPDDLSRNKNIRFEMCFPVHQRTSKTLSKNRVVVMPNFLILSRLHF